MKKLNDLKLKNKKYLIFDLDGTLIDSIGIWNKVDQEVIQEYGNMTIDLNNIQIERDEFLHNNMDSDIYLTYCDYLIKKYGLSIHDPKKLLEIRWEKSGVILENEMDFKEGSVEVILRLKSLGFTLVLATMTTQVQLDILSKKNKTMLNKLNILETFDLITKKEDVKNKKPDPEIYNKIMQYYKIEPSECLIFEDSYTGVLAGKNAGIEVVNVYDKYADVDRKRIEKLADYSIKNFNEFLEFINQIYTTASIKSKVKVSD